MVLPPSHFIRQSSVGCTVDYSLYGHLASGVWEHGNQSIDTMNYDVLRIRERKSRAHLMRPSADIEIKFRNLVFSIGYLSTLAPETKNNYVRS